MFTSFVYEAKKWVAMVSKSYDLIGDSHLIEEAKLTFDGVNLKLSVSSVNKNETREVTFEAYFVSKIKILGIGHAGGFNLDTFNSMVVSDGDSEEKIFSTFLDEFGKIEFSAKSYSISK